MGTARDLTITSWLREPHDSPFTIAVPGLKLTGWWSGALPTSISFDGLLRIWPQEATIKTEIDILEGVDGEEHQICAYVRIHRYPSNWLDVVGKSLSYFIAMGAKISWAGGWECFLQYSSTEKFEGCYAALTDQTGLVGASGLDEPLTYLDQIPGVARRLHAAVAMALQESE